MLQDHESDSGSVAAPTLSPTLGLELPPVVPQKSALRASRLLSAFDFGNLRLDAPPSPVKLSSDSSPPSPVELPDHSSTSVTTSLAAPSPHADSSLPANSSHTVYLSSEEDASSSASDSDVDDIEFSDGHGDDDDPDDSQRHLAARVQAPDRGVRPQTRELDIKASPSRASLGPVRQGRHSQEDTARVVLVIRYGRPSIIDLSGGRRSTTPASCHSAQSSQSKSTEPSPPSHSSAQSPIFSDSSDQSPTFSIHSPLPHSSTQSSLSHLASPTAAVATAPVVTSTASSPRLSLWPAPTIPGSLTVATNTSSSRLSRLCLDHLTTSSPAPACATATYALSRNKPLFLNTDPYATPVPTPSSQQQLAPISPVSPKTPTALLRRTINLVRRRSRSILAVPGGDGNSSSIYLPECPPQPLDSPSSLASAPSAVLPLSPLSPVCPFGSGFDLVPVASETSTSFPTLTSVPSPTKSKRWIPSGFSAARRQSIKAG